MQMQEWLKEASNQQAGIEYHLFYFLPAG